MRARPGRAALQRVYEIAGGRWPPEMVRPEMVSPEMVSPEMVRAVLGHVRLRVHPFIVGLVAVIACNGFFLPYQSTAYLALYAGTAGKLFAHRQVVPTALAYGVWTLVAVVGSVPVWRMMGLI